MLTVTPPPPTPTAAALSGLSVNPSTVTGGATSTGTVILTSAAPTGGFVVSLSSSDTGAATVPGSVTVPAGATSATFAVTTVTDSTNRSAVISAVGGGVTRTATLTVNASSPLAASPTPTAPRAPTATPARTPTPTMAPDSVAITRAEYDSGNRRLRVEATSSSASATLRVYVTSTNTLVGTLSNNGGGRYSADLSWSTNPQTITVRSSLGGSATASVVAR